MTRFPCTTAGAVLAGRRKLRLILLLPAWIMIAATVAAWVTGQVFGGLLSLFGAVVLYALWRMANRHEPIYLEVDGGRLRFRLRWQLFEVDVDSAACRRLTAPEKAHLERLVDVGGLVATSGGYDSHQLGEFDLYASNLDHAVLLETQEARFVVTPDDPDAFVEAIAQSG